MDTKKILDDIDNFAASETQKFLQLDSLHIPNSFSKYISTDQDGYMLIASEATVLMRSDDIRVIVPYGADTGVVERQLYKIAKSLKLSPELIKLVKDQLH